MNLDWLTPGARAFYGPALVYIAALPEQRKDGAWEVQASVFSGLGQPFPVAVAKLERIVTAGEIERAEAEIQKLRFANSEARKDLEFWVNGAPEKSSIARDRWECMRRAVAMLKETD